MGIVRQIVNVKGGSLKVDLPDDFLAEKAEVIVLPIDEKKVEVGEKLSDRFRGAISKETAAKIHHHLQKVKHEWE